MIHRLLIISRMVNSSRKWRILRERTADMWNWVFQCDLSFDSYHFIIFINYYIRKLYTCVYLILVKNYLWYHFNLSLLKNRWTISICNKLGDYQSFYCWTAKCRHWRGKCFPMDVACSILYHHTCEFSLLLADGGQCIWHTIIVVRRMACWHLMKTSQQIFVGSIFVICSFIYRCSMYDSLFWLEIHRWGHAVIILTRQTIGPNIYWCEAIINCNTSIKMLYGVLNSVNSMHCCV